MLFITSGFIKNKQIIFSIMLIVFSLKLYGIENDVTSDKLSNTINTHVSKWNQNSNTKGMFISNNILAPLNFYQESLFSFTMAFLTNMENGVSINLGYFFTPYISLENRVSIGTLSDIFFVFQYHWKFIFYKFNHSE